MQKKELTRMIYTLEDYEKYKHPFNMPVSYRNWGSPMGREDSFGPMHNKTRRYFYDSVHFHCVKVPLNGDYDKGGAYWGAGEPLYCIHAFQHIDGTTNNYRAQFFARASNRDEAKKQAIEYFVNAITFFK